MASARCFIFPGRFQPFHNGHHAVVQTFLRDFSEFALCLAIIFDFRPENIKPDTFDIQSAEHFLPERNPWPLLQRLSAVQRYIRSQENSKLLTTLMPRPSRTQSWSIIERMFEAPRTWIVPSCGEDWDDKKANFFEEMGDDVLRISTPQEVDGYRIRTALAEKKYEVVRRSVPFAIWESIESRL